MRFLMSLFLWLTAFTLRAQQEPETGISGDALEILSEKDAAVGEHDVLPEAEMDYFRRHPLPLNLAGASELEGLQLLTASQIRQFLLYRNLMGRLISIYELQAVPGWDIPTIRNLLPYVKLDGDWAVPVSWKDRFARGSSQFLWRYGRAMEFRNFQYGNSLYSGSPDRLLFRYTFQNKQWLQWCLAAEKDAGEPLLGHRGGKGFDFYSFHMLVRQLGKIETLVFGDYTVNIGQGLIQWQNLAFRKGGSFTADKRQAPLLKPYRALGEFNFYRGAALLLRHRRWEGLCFAALQRVDAHLEIDSGNDQGVFATSLLTSGYHRTPGEMKSRRNQGQRTLGGRLALHSGKGVWGISGVHHVFTHPFLHGLEPYQRYYPAGRIFFNYSVDYAVTWNNCHVFGEMAVNQTGAKGFVSGLLVSLHAKLDATVLLRSYDPGYTAWYSNAFGENSRPGNERGLYAALQFRPVPALQLFTFFDLYRFPWLRYRLSVPGGGREMWVQCTYTPAKNISVTGRLRFESGVNEVTEPPAPLATVSSQTKTQFRLQAQFQPAKVWGFKSRMEWVQVLKSGDSNPEEGFLVFVDAHYAPAPANWRMAIRGAYYDTESYQSRIYAYENEGSASFGMQLFYGKGFRWSVLQTIKSLKSLLNGPNSTVSIGIKISQNISLFPRSGNPVSGLNVRGNAPDLTAHLTISF